MVWFRCEMVVIAWYGLDSGDPVWWGFEWWYGVLLEPTGLVLCVAIAVGIGRCESWNYKASLDGRCYILIPRSGVWWWNGSIRDGKRRMFWWKSSGMVWWWRWLWCPLRMPGFMSVVRPLNDCWPPWCLINEATTQNRCQIWTNDDSLSPLLWKPPLISSQLSRSQVKSYTFMQFSCNFVFKDFCKVHR